MKPNHKVPALRKLLEQLRMPTAYMLGNGQRLPIMRRMVTLTQRDSGETTSECRGLR